MSDIGYYVHPLAHVDRTVEIGDRTKIWQFASVLRNAEIGADCVIGSCAIVDGAILGDGSHLGHGAQLHPGTWVEPYCFIGPGAICCNDRWPHVSKVGFDYPGLISKQIISVVIARGASVGAGAMIMPGVWVGTGAMVASGARVDRSVPAHHLMKASGEIVLIDPSRTERMRSALVQREPEAAE